MARNHLAASPSQASRSVAAEAAEVAAKVPPSSAAAVAGQPGRLGPAECRAGTGSRTASDAESEGSAAQAAAAAVGRGKDTVGGGAGIAAAAVAAAGADAGTAKVVDPAVAGMEASSCATVRGTSCGNERRGVRSGSVSGAEKACGSRSGRTAGEASETATGSDGAGISGEVTESGMPSGSGSCSGSMSTASASVG